MKKFTLLFSAMLFSVMSFATVITFDADVDKGNAGTDSNNAAAYTITKDGVTVTVTSGILGTYNNEMHYRIYKNQTLTVTSTVGNVTSVEFTCTANDDAKYGPGCFTWSTGNYTYSGAKGTWSGSASEVVFTASSNQVRATQVVVTIDGEGGGDNSGTGDGNGGNDNDTTGTVPPTDGVITCAQAVEICKATGETATEETYTIRGYVTSIASAYNATYDNTSFWMADTQNGGNVFEAFRSKPLAEADKTVKVGDYVEVTGKLVNYKGETPETDAGGTYTILVAGDGGSTEKPEAKPLTDGYTKVTNISALANGDKVVLYCDEYAVGVAGFDGNKSGVMAETGWVEYVVELVDGGMKLKDDTAGQYAALPEKNCFKYNEAGSVFTVTENALLSSVLEADGKTYLLYRNTNSQYGSPLCRMYVDKSGNAEYAPFYVYKVATSTDVEDVTTVVVPVKVLKNGQVLIMRGENVYNVAGVQVK